MEQNNTNKPKYQKNPNECGAIWVKENDKGQEYLSIKLDLDGQEYFLKGFISSGFDENRKSRPKFLVFRSNHIPNPTSKESFGRRNKLD